MKLLSITEGAHDANCCLQLCVGDHHKLQGETSPQGGNWKVTNNWNTRNLLKHPLHRIVHHTLSTCIYPIGCEENKKKYKVLKLGGEKRGAEKSESEKEAKTKVKAHVFKEELSKPRMF